jgi:large subunit ribosomal protein L28
LAHRPVLSGPTPCGILCHSVLTREKSESHMSKVCVICGKKPSFGNNRSHSMRATPRRWDPNVQKVRIQLDGKPTQAYVCTKCLKGHKVQKVA